MFPVMFLVLLGVIVNGETIHALGGIDATTYFVPGVITLAVVSATMVNLAMSLTILREGGILKRLPGNAASRAGCSSPGGSATRW